jgi:hypothetical protein
VTSDDQPPTDRPQGLDPAGAVRWRPDGEQAPADRHGPARHAAPPAPRDPKRRRWWPLAALAALAAALAGLGIGAALWSGDDPEERRPAPAASTQPPPEPEPQTASTPAPSASAEDRPGRRPVRVRFKRLRGGLPGTGEVSLTPQGKGTALMEITARFRRAEFAVYLVRNGRERKQLASARGGRLRYKNAVSVKALTRRYDGIVVVTRRMPGARRRVRSLGVKTSTLARRLARRRAGR